MADSMPARHLSQRRHSLNARQIANGAIVPFSTLPTCAAFCGSLFDVQGKCSPPSRATVDDSCFCSDSRLTPFSQDVGTAGISSVCGSGSCSAATDLQAIKTWYTYFCAKNGLTGLASTITSTAGTTTRTAVLLSTSFSTIGGPIRSPTTSILPKVSGQPNTSPAELQGLSVGAKTGIAVGIIIAFLLVLLILWRIVTQRKKRDGLLKSGKGNGICPPRPNTYEVMTLANTHEMITKHNASEMDGHTGKNVVKAGTVKADVLAAMKPGEIKREQATLGELSAGGDTNASGSNTEAREVLAKVSAAKLESPQPVSSRTFHFVFA